MKRWRFLGFVPLALLLVHLVHNLSNERELALKDQLGLAKASEASETHSPEKNAKRLLDGRVAIIPLYKFGDLPSSKQSKETKKSPPVIKKIPSPKKTNVRHTPNNTPQKKQTATVAASAIPKPRTIQGVREGGRPILIASYDQIGFDRYLNIVESVGRFFVLLKQNGGTKIGPPVSLLLRTTLPLERKLVEGFAAARPHMVSDEKVQRRLGAMHLPANAYSDRVALLFTKRFDRSLWSAVDKALQRKKLTLPQVVEVNGHYIRGLEGFYLMFDTARLKHDGGHVRLNDAIRVAL